jgi:GNAT superfamily N-acetyltransferase
MVGEMKELRERMAEAGLGLREALDVIGLTLEDLSEQGIRPEEIFKGLNELMDRTVKGSRIERFSPGKGSRPFHVFEIHTDDGEVLGYLNMIYMRKPIPCYYLVYVEVLPLFRRRGLGNRILKAFREFVEEKRAVGLLDNIIPPHEPTYDIYTKLGWRNIEEVVEGFVSEPPTHYMVYIPRWMRGSVGRRDLLRLLYNLSKKRQVIDMRENEAMVRRTIEAFRSIYSSLERIFRKELSQGRHSPLMRFMFTKFTTKFLGFRRRISRLIGYTGGESLEQIVLSEAVRNLPIQSYSLWGRDVPMWEGCSEGLRKEDLPEALLQDPTGFIEALPLYRRPYLISWLEEKGLESPVELRIVDLLELGFDPTRLRHLRLGDYSLVIERASAGMLDLVRRRVELLGILRSLAGRRSFAGAALRVNEPLGLVTHRGNIYVLRRMIPAIHEDEALEQLRSRADLRAMCDATRLDRLIIRSISEAKEWMISQLGDSWREDVEELTFFIPWDLEVNRIAVLVDPTGPSLENIWVA